VARLRKAEAESLLSAYDHDPVGALTGALRVVLDHPEAGWEALVGLLPPGRRAPLLERRPSALDALAAELNETRAAPLG
jgi:hypothetical protein